jgi:hypothetical protein
VSDDPRIRSGSRLQLPVVKLAVQEHLVDDQACRRGYAPLLVDEELWPFWWD